MQTSFAFYRRPPPDAPSTADFRRTSGRGACLALPLDVADRFDRKGYGSSRWGYLAVETGACADEPRRSGEDPVLAFDATCVVRARGPRETESGEAGIVLVTLVDLAAADEEAFLAQFVRASAVMSRHAGFRAARLYRAKSDGDGVRFVNLASWASVEDFVDAFSSPAFRAVLTGGFETTSTIMTARLPGHAQETIQ